MKGKRTLTVENYMQGEATLSLADYLRVRILTEAVKRKLSVYMLSKISGVDRYTLTGFLEGSRTMRISTLERLLKGLDLELTVATSAKTPEKVAV